MPTPEAIATLVAAHPHFARYVSRAQAEPCPHNWAEWMDGTVDCERRPCLYQSDINYAAELIESALSFMGLEDDE